MKFFLQYIMACTIILFCSSRVFTKDFGNIRPKIPIELAKQIVKDITKNNDDKNWFKEKYNGNIDELISYLDFIRIDLNQDGLLEYIILPHDIYFCGSGGCSLWIYRSTKKNYEALFGIKQEDQLVTGPGAANSCRIKKTSTNGYLDLECNIRDGTAVLKFDGKIYHVERWHVK